MENFNENNCNFKAEITRPPTYLREFFLDDEIILVYEKSHNISYNDGISPEKPCIKIEENDNSSALELTGNPLKVDLEGDVSFASDVKYVRLNHWTAEESEHFPFTIKWARSYINQQNRIKKCEGEKQKAIYVVCDGSDPSCTVLLGAQKCDSSLLTALVNIVGYYPRDHEVISLEAMEKDHIKNTRIKNPKVDFLVKFKYYLYGTFLHSFKIENRTEHYGSISVELTCNKCIFNVPRNPSSIKMKLKIITGHNVSSVHFLWEELCLLQNYLDILSDSDKCNDERTIICKNPISDLDLHRSINNIIGSHLLKREAKSKFDLKNIRQGHILDNLWNILKCCENLSDLRDILHYFFEELVEAESNIKIPESDKSNIASIVSGILHGKIAVPTLTFSQALECLFELGAEKLKNDYETIIKNFYSTSDQAISMNWSKFQNEELKAIGGHRKTRVTANLKFGFIDLDHNTSKLAYLGKFHVATELIYLLKEEACLPEETFDYFCERVYKNFVAKDIAPHDFTDLQSSPLCEFEITLNSADTNIVEKETPVIWAMQMASKVKDLKVTTTYHLSQYPIFPTAIYNDYDVSEATGDTKMKYYVSKMIRYKEFI